MHEKPYTSELSSRHSDTHNLLPHSKQTTQWQRQCVTVRFNLNAPKPWICVSIGSEIGNARTNSGSTGDLVNSIMQITGQNTIQQNIIKTFAGIFSRRIWYWKCYGSKKKIDS